MADPLTHSHDTATPALSVESEYVLVPRDRAHRHAVELEQCSIFAADVGEAIAKSMTDAAADLRLALAAAPAPNPSPAAKGGEAVEPKPDPWEGVYRAGYTKEQWLEIAKQSEADAAHLPED